MIFAIRALAARVDQTANTHLVPDLKSFHCRSNIRYRTDNFMPRDHGINGIAPFITGLMDIGMADAAISDVNGHIIGAGISTRNL